LHSHIVAVVAHLAPDSIRRLERAAQDRYNEAQYLLTRRHRLAALYLLGYCVEMCLTAAFFHSAGFPPHVPIDSDTRRRRMALGRQVRDPNGVPLMNSDPHPIVGWARLLERQRSASPSLPTQQAQALKQAIANAEAVYKHWRPELRYKTTQVTQSQVDEVRKAAAWFLERRGRL
jgi:hypothetical protein